MQPVKVYLDENDIIIVELYGKQAYDTIHPTRAVIKTEVDKLLQKGKSLNLIADVSNMTGFDSSARRGAFENLKADRTLGYKKIALVGAGIFYQKIFHFLLLVAGKDYQIKFFDSRKDATKWILE